MAKISALPAATTLNTTDDFPIVQAGVTKKSAISLLGLVANTASNRTYAGPNAAGATLTLLSTNNASKGNIIFGSTGVSAYDDVNQRLGLGTTTPAVALHSRGLDRRLWLENTNAGITALTRIMPGVEISTGEMNTTSKFGSAVKFLSTDSAFTTENPKFLAGIIPRATETYAADTAGGMALDFGVTPNAPGATSTPTIRASLHLGLVVGSGYVGNAAPTNGMLVEKNVGIGTTDPSTYGLYVAGVDANQAGLRVDGHTLSPAVVALPGSGSGDTTQIQMGTAGSLTTEMIRRLSFGIYLDAGSSNWWRFKTGGEVAFLVRSGDPGTEADRAHIYAKDVVAVANLFVRNEAGTPTQISCHHPITGEPVLHHHEKANPEGEIIYWHRVCEALEALRDGQQIPAGLLFRESCDLGCGEDA